MTNSASKAVMYGITGGVIGGILFGIIMQMQGMIVMLAGTMGSESAVMGWMMHMIISVIFGISFAILTFVIKNIWALAIVFGIGIWIVGPLVIMPMMMGMGTNLANAFTPDQLMSLVTHLFFSFIVAVVFNLLAKKSTVKTEAVA
ncbi:hypothetical protein [Halobacillus campisalis]|uniref:DUF1440 domain-containing protein n=1 Tax=Halobacillus campisalis TaxID=435909 RepID=A0ABW2K6Q3_9BACI|nr:hypothetical protein [Halobacillus campisalis]